MADEVVAPAAPIADEPFEDFFKAGNEADAARLRGEEPAPAPAAESPDDVPADEVAPADDAKPADKKADGRTLEGRRQKLYQQVEELTTQRHQTKRDIDEARAEVARLRAEMAQLGPQQPRQPQPPPRPQTFEPEPRLEQFAKLSDGKDNPDPYTSWLVARQDWTARETQRQFVARAERAQEERSWLSRVDAAEKAAPGLTEKIRAATIPLSRDTMPYIKRHPMGPQIAAYLVDHEDIAQRLVTLHPVEQIGQIGEIVGELRASAQAAKSGSAAPKPVSTAKAPIQPLGTSPVASAVPPGDDESVEAHIRRGNAEDRKRGRL